MNRRNFLGLIGITATGIFLWPREAAANIPPFPPCGKCLPDKPKSWPPPVEEPWVGSWIDVPLEMNEQMERIHRQIVLRQYKGE